MHTGSFGLVEVGLCLIIFSLDFPTPPGDCFGMIEIWQGYRRDVPAVVSFDMVKDEVGVDR